MLRRRISVTIPSIATASGFQEPVRSESILGTSGGVRLLRVSGDQVTGFVFLRVRAHRLLLAAALLAVLLTTCVLAALTAFSGSVGDAALRHTLTHRSAESAALFVSAEVERDRRAEADATVRRAAADTFDALPVTVRKLETSGPYALPRGLQAPVGRRGEPDLTHLASLDRSRVRLTEGRMPVAGAGAPAGPVQVALPVPPPRP